MLLSSNLHYLVFISLLILTGCSQYAAPVCLSGSYLNSEKHCVAIEAPVHHIPFQYGFSTKVTQGYHGLYTHKGDEAYAVDFSCETGDPIAASRSGKVLYVKEDSDEGCSDASCTDMANYVTIDHGDGTFSEYGHLQHLGALVKPGDDVCAGDLIALCGSTGYSLSPHLHFSVLDHSRRTLPVQFAEPRLNRSFGFAIPDAQYTSQNGQRATCKKVDYSPLSKSAFAHQGIVLSEDLDVQFPRSPTIVRGKYFGDHPYVAIHRRAVDSNDWRSVCYPVKDANFEALIEWDPSDEKGHYFMMMVGANKYCAAPVSGWSWAYLIQMGQTKEVRELKAP